MVDIEAGWAHIWQHYGELLQSMSLDADARLLGFGTFRLPT